MVDIDYKQYKTLRRIRNKKAVQVSDLTPEELGHCDYLESHGFIESCDKLLGDSVESFCYETESYKITEKGCAQLFAFITSFHKWWIPLIISIASFILSVIVFIKS